MRRLVRTICLLALMLVAAASSALASPVTLQNATATFSQSATGAFGEPFLVSEAIDGSFNTLTNGWAIFDHSLTSCDCTSPETAVFETTTDQGFAGGTLFTFTLYQLLTVRAPDFRHSIGDFRLSYTTDARSSFADGLQVGGDVTATWTALVPMTAVSSFGALLTIQGDNSILASGPNGVGTYTITATTPTTGITGFRIEMLAHASLPFNGPGREDSNGNFVLTEFVVDAQSLQAVPEPTTAALTIGGLVVGGYVRRRQRQIR